LVLTPAAIIVGGVAVAAFVQPDRFDRLVLPGFGGMEREGAWGEWPVWFPCAGENEAGAAASLLEAVAEEFAAEGLGDGDASLSGAALRRDEAGAGIPASSDVDEVCLEVDVIPLQGLEFAASQAGEEGRRVDRPVGW
jgi:hypothetical protein